MSEHKTDATGEATSAVESRTERASVRRDPRADPDDEPTASRVDVFTDRGAESLSSAALSLRRELAKLSQQAAAVERSIEEQQRRERAEALERIEAANGKALEAEQNLKIAEAEVATLRRLHETALAEIQSVRSERDELRAAADESSKAKSELAELQAETETLREAHASALKEAATLQGELAELRKREQAGTEKATASESELQAMRERIDRLTAELAQAREETTEAKAEGARFRDESRAATEAAEKKQSDLERDLANAQEEVARLEKALADARTFEEKASTAQSELEAARITAAETRSEVHRLEREVEAARRERDVTKELVVMSERETTDLRTTLERRERELEMALAATASANARATAAERARAMVEEGARQLRDEVMNAFTRWRAVTPSMVPPPVATTSSIAPALALLSSMRPGTPSESAPPGLGSIKPDIEGVIAVSSTPPPVAEEPPSADGGPVTKRATSEAPVSARPATSSDEPEAVLDEAEIVEDYPARIAPPPPPLPKKPAGMSEAPPASADERDALFGQLAQAGQARDAAIKLLIRPEWLQGKPPLELLVALTLIDYDADSPLLQLGRAWEREPLAHAIVGALRDEPDAKAREHGAWLLRHLGTASTWSSMAELLGNEEESIAVRRWLLEGVEDLVRSKGLGWSEVGELVSRLAKSSDASLRNTAVGVMAALDASDDKRRTLLEIVQSEDDEVVLAAAVQALAGALPVELDPVVKERLLAHPSARVQQSVLELVERTKSSTS